MTIQFLFFTIFCLLAIVGMFVLEIKYPNENTTEFFNEKLFIIKKFVNKASKYFS
jgi:hypothetical protein